MVFVKLLGPLKSVRSLFLCHVQNPEIFTMGKVGTPQPRIQPSSCNTWPFCGALPRYEPLGPHPWDHKFSLLPYVSPSALKVTPLSFFLLFKLKWLRQLTSAVFSMAIGVHLQYYITSLCFKFSHFSHDQPEKTNSFGFINKLLLLYCIYHRVKGLIIICGSRIEQWEKQ